MCCESKRIAVAVVKLCSYHREPLGSVKASEIPFFFLGPFGPRWLRRSRSFRPHQAGFAAPLVAFWKHANGAVSVEGHCDESTNLAFFLLAVCGSSRRSFALRVADSNNIRDDDEFIIVTLGKERSCAHGGDLLSNENFKIMVRNLQYIQIVALNAQKRKAIKIIH